MLGCLGIAGPAHALVSAPSLPQAVLAASGIVTVAYDQQVENAQRWLNRLGFDAGPVDGFTGRRTQDAIRAYQRARGQTVSGQLDRATLRSLRQEYRVATGAEPQRTAAPAPTPAPTPATDIPAPGMPPMPSPASTQLVVDTQVELRRRGYDVPVVNGTLDARTAEAIRSFEHDQRLLVTGLPSAPLLERIRSIEPVLSRRELTRGVQLALTERGYHPGPADGAMGRATVDAIRTYQADAGLTVDGVADAALLASLQQGAAVKPVDPVKVPVAVAEAPRQVILLNDDFSDGDYVGGVRWQVLKGAFAVRDGVLHSRVVQPPAAQEILPKDVLFQVMKGLLGEPADAQVPLDAAAIGTAVAIPNEFRVRLRLSTGAEAGARFTFGPYQSQPSNGYQLVFDDFPRAVPTILAASAGSQLRVVGRGTAVDGLDDGRTHDIDWVRDAAGNMSVSVDGRVVLQALDNGFTQAFDGLVMVNASGSWAVDQVRVDATAR